METALKESGSPRILQKRQKGSEIKFQVVPPKQEAPKGGDESNPKTPSTF